MIGLIGGSGTYKAELLKNKEEREVETPFGKPSDKIVLGELFGKKIAFLSRHGVKHTLSPSNVNYRANIHALKEIGCKQIIAINAVGSLQENIAPGHLVFPNQFIDRTYGRKRTFYDKEKVCHISMAEPFCPELRKVLIEEAKNLNLEFHEKGTYVCIEGPRFSTRAESHLFRSWKADIIGMTLCPEAVLAREAELCYANISAVTDFDCWKESIVSAEEVIQTMKKNTASIQKLLEKVIPKVPEQRKCFCKDALKDAFI